MRYRLAKTLDLLRRPRTRRLLLDAAAVLLAVVVGAAAFSAAARASVTVGPARLAVAASLAASPRTVVELPPLGSVRAKTHRGPLLVVVRLEEIDIAETSRIIGDSSFSLPGTTPPEIASVAPEGTLSAMMWRLLGAGLAAAAGAGALVAIVLRRKVAVVGLAAGLALVLPAAVAGIAYGTWDAKAFREPTLQGSLVDAQQLLDVFSTRVAGIERLREQAGQLASDLAAYYADDRSLAIGGSLAGTYRVIHVTDLHLDPVGAELERTVARSYDASLVIDTGDLPIVGAQIEAEAYARLVDPSVPRVYVPGNHDSPASIAELRRLGVTVLETGTVEVDGFRIFGVADPVSRDGSLVPSPSLVTADAKAAAAGLRARVKAGQPRPDIVAVHNPLMAASFVGITPLILDGHLHKASLSTRKGTTILNSGTTGGMPFDPKASGRKVDPYGLSVLYYTAELPRRLIAIDRIAVYPSRSTTLSREIVDESLLPRYGSTDASASAVR